MMRLITYLVEQDRNETKTFSIQSTGKGRHQVFRLVNRADNSLHKMFFDSKKAAEDYCDENKFVVDNSSMG